MAEISLGKAIELLQAEYARAEKLEFVINPLAYALYKVWKRVDSNKQNRRPLMPRGEKNG